MFAKIVKISFFKNVTVVFFKIYNPDSVRKTRHYLIKAMRVSILRTRKLENRSFKKNSLSFMNSSRHFFFSTKFES